MNGNTLLFAGLLTGAALLGNAADFFRTDEDPGKDLPADKIYPQNLPVYWFSAEKRCNAERCRIHNGGSRLWQKTYHCPVQ